MPAKIVKHTFFTPDSKAIQCERCGGKDFLPPLPVPFSYLSERIRLFNRHHRHCLPQINLDEQKQKIQTSAPHPKGIGRDDALISKKTRLSWETKPTYEP